MSTLDRRLKALTEKYLEYEKFDANRRYVENLMKFGDVRQLERIIGKRLTFGTAGIRGEMGPGFGQMNDLVIIQTSQGLASYLLEVMPVECREKGVLIGNDARHNSDRFARLAALAFLQKRIPVYFCDYIIPTPLIAYGVKHYGCCAGIVVTASHNPKNDNGYKVYWSNGAQILTPHDKNIQDHIERDSNQQPWPLAWDHELLLPESPQPLPEGWPNILSRVHGDLRRSYFNYIEALVGERRDRNQAAGIGITYTTMHGVGHTFLSRALELAGFDDAFPVELQKKPDPDFPTVKFPNPEEAGALDLAFETANHANSNLILANDPDADRCAGAIYDPKTKYRRVLTGNEIGHLLGWWVWYCHNNSSSYDSISYFDSLESDAQSQGATPTTPKTDIQKAEPRDCYMITTAVSSKFLQSMARVEGFNFIETLTGFKYMGNVACDLISQGKSVLFAFEEAIGYMVDSGILDKDGISAAVQLAQCAAFISAAYCNRTLEQHLDWLYTRYGYHYNLNSYFICHEPEKIAHIFKTLQANYPKSFGKFPITRIRDLNKGYDSGTPDHKPTLPCSSSSFMVTFFVADDITFTIRTSGTEPKIKYYSEIVAKLPPLKAKNAPQTNNFNEDEQLKAKESAQTRLHELVQLATEFCLQPELHNLVPAE